MQLHLARGYVYATSDAISSRANSLNLPVKKQDGHFHVTLLTKTELQSLTVEKRARLNEVLSEKRQRPDQDLILLGLGSDRKRLVFFDVFHWAEGSEIRKDLGLPAANFHMTLSEANDHVSEIARNVGAIHHDGFNTVLSERDFDAAFLANLSKDNIELAHILANFYRKHNRMSAIAHVRYADCMQKRNFFKYAACAYTYAADLACIGKKMQNYCIRQVSKCARFTDFPPVFTEDEAGQVHDIVADGFPEYLSLPSPSLRRKIQLHFADYVTEQTQRQNDDVDLARLLPVSLPSRDRIYLCRQDDHFKLPRFFRWIVPYRLAAMATPRSKDDIDLLYSQLGITLVVTLTQETPLSSSWFTDGKVENVFMPVENYKAPSLAQVDHFIKRVTALPDGEAALVHCGAGKGRAGTFVACYLAKLGFHSRFQDQEPGNSNDVVKLLRHMRPGSIETEEQERFVGKYVSHLWKTFCAPSSAHDVSEPGDTPLQLDGTLPGSTKTILLCGLPGSGKSTFAAMLMERAKNDIAVVSQDEVGSRSAFVNSLSTAAKSRKRVIVDKCHPTVENRREALNLLFNPTDALCVHFVYSSELCTLRANERTAHPTIRQGSAERIVKRFEKEFVNPQRSEGFACIATVTSFAAAATLIAKLVGNARVPVSDNVLPRGSAPPEVGMKMTKFPRTRHLLNLGAATRDDLVLSGADADLFLSTEAGVVITIEEKVDGANMGISIDKDTQVFRVQNRSHYVNSKSHEQFRKLDAWLERNGHDLRAVIEPGRTILFGEWLYAKHSVAYTKLPDLFLIFDIFDVQTEKYLARSVISEKLTGTNLHQVPSIRHPERGLSPESLKALATETRSSFYHGVVEGIYIRRERDGVLLDRAKVVRRDFIAGNDHWTKGKLLLNGVMYDHI